MLTRLLFFIFCLWNAQAGGLQLIAGVNYPGETFFRKLTDPKPQGVFSELIIPLKRAGRLLLVEATVDSIRGNFIFDTGAPGLVLNASYFPDSRAVPGMVASGITGSAGPVRAKHVGHLALRDLSYHDIQAEVVDLSHLENARGVQILGLLGVDLFTSFEIEIDLRSSVLRLVRCNKRGNPLVHSERSWDLTSRIQLIDKTIYLNCSMADRNMVFGFDTGAEVNALNSRSNKKVLEQVEITGRSVLRGTGSSTVEILYGTMQEFTFCDENFAGMQTIITSMSHMNAGYGASIDGMLGVEFLNRGIVRLNLIKGEMSMLMFKPEENE